MERTTDSINLDTLAGKNELALLRTLKVGDVRKELFMPAVPKRMEWHCIVRGENPEWWMFEGRFCGQPVLTMTIAVKKSTLELSIKE